MTFTPTGNIFQLFKNNKCKKNIFNQKLKGFKLKIIIRSWTAMKIHFYMENQDS
jgi:hypothetical protein